jgi:hypothetical protein
MSHSASAKLERAALQIDSFQISCFIIDQVADFENKYFPRQNFFLCTCRFVCLEILWISVLPEAGKKHVGSLDVDICFDLQWISNESYETILKILHDNGYYQTNPRKPFSMVGLNIQVIKFSNFFFMTAHAHDASVAAVTELTSQRT